MANNQDNTENFKNGQHPVLQGVWYLIWAVIYLFVIMPICLTSCIFYLIFSPMSTILPPMAPLTELFQAGVETPEKLINHLYNSSPQNDMEMLIQWRNKVKAEMEDCIQNAHEFGNNAKIGIENNIQKAQE